MTRALVIAALALVLSGCVHSRIGNQSYLGRQAIDRANDTRRTLVNKWGHPDYVDGDLWVWNVEATDGSPLWEQTRTYSHVVSFLPNGHVRKYRVYSTAKRAKTWSLWPF